MFATTPPIDTTVMQFADSIRSIPLTVFFEWVTNLGDARTITVVAIALALVLWRHRRFTYKAGFAVALFGSLLTSWLLKHLIERPRPDHALSLISESGYSFPSMHATVSMATYGFLAFVMWRVLRPRSHRAPAVAVLVALIVCIGLSRIYLEVHYFSDIVSGYVIGVLFVWFGVMTTNALSARDRAASKAAPSGRSGHSRPV